MSIRSSIFRALGLGLIGIALVGCGTTLSKEQQAQLDQGMDACQSSTSSHVDEGHCRWAVIGKYYPITAYDNLAYARDILLRGMVDRGEITSGQADGLYGEYSAQLQFLARQEHLANMQQVNRNMQVALQDIDRIGQPTFARPSHENMYHTAVGQWYAHHLQLIYIPASKALWLLRG